MFSLFEGLDGHNILKAVLPFLVAILGIALSLITVPVPYFGTSRPDFLLMFVFFWAIYRPTFFPPSLIFITGIIVDLIINSLVGLTPLLLICIFMLIKSQRRFLMAQSFMIQWLCFAVVSIGYAFAEWAVTGLYHFELVLSHTIWMTLVLNICIFPLLALVLIKIHKIISVK